MEVGTKKSFYHIDLAIRLGFWPSRMTSNN